MELAKPGGCEKEASIRADCRTRGEEKNQPGIVDVNRLAQKLVEHPDLQSISEEKRVECVVSLLVMTGCDFTSHISGSIKPASLACSSRMPTSCVARVLTL